MERDLTWGEMSSENIVTSTLGGVGNGASSPLCPSVFQLDRASVPSPIAIEILMDTMARDRVPMYLFSV